MKFLLDNGADLNFYKLNHEHVYSFKYSIGIHYNFMTPVSRLLNCISTTDLENNKVICDILDYFNQKGFDFNRVFEHQPARYASIITQQANYIYDCITGYPIRNKQKDIQQRLLIHHSLGQGNLNLILDI